MDDQSSKKSTKYPDGPLTILTEPPQNFKRLIKNALFFLTRNPRFLTVGGPASVIGSLTRGLNELGIPFRLNPGINGMTSTVAVVSGVKALQWAIGAKKKGLIKTLVAGPNIVVAPTDFDNLIKDPVITKVIVPSEWNKKWWLTFDQYFLDKAVVWPAGAQDHGNLRDKDGVCMVYSKNADEKLFNRIIETLWEHKFPIAISKYGQFRQSEYFRMLKKTKFMIYLSESESQGLAMLEAWMADVPTLVWNRGYFEYQGRRIDEPTVAAPYLTPACGMVFSGADDFESKLLEFIEKYDSFKPREYALSRFTDRFCAGKYIEIIRNAEKSK